MDKRNCAGQSLVELALTLPCFCLGIFLGVQLILYGHNMIELQRMAQLAADRTRDGAGIRIADYRWFHGLWGNAVVQPMKLSSTRPSPWRPHRGVTPWRQPGSLMQVRVGAVLVPSGGFSRSFLPVTQYAFAQTYAEPAIQRGK